MPEPTPESIPEPTCAASGDEYDPEPLSGIGAAPTPGEPIANPSHPVRSHVRPATWRQVTPSREAERRYCVCGMLLPMVMPERCSDCGRAVKGVTQ